MRIAVAATSAGPDARVAHRLGHCEYLVIHDTESSTFRAVPGPGDSGGHGAGIRTIALALQHDVNAIIAGYASPDIARTLRADGIVVVVSKEASVRDAVEAYRLGSTPAPQACDDIGGATAVRASLAKSGRQFGSVMPVLLGVIMLVGLFKALVTKDVILSVFTGDGLRDAAIGAGIGSVLAGNPINSYVVGDAMRAMGVGLVAVTALIVTWAGVGLVQLPAEASALGFRFAVSRTAVALLLSIPLALLAVFLTELLT